MIYKSSNITQIDEDVDLLKSTIGTTSISSIGDGTVTGALSEISKLTLAASNVPPVINSFSINPTTDVYDADTGITSLYFTVDVTKKSKDITVIYIYIKTKSGTLLDTLTMQNVANGGSFNYNYVPSSAITETVDIVLSVEDGASDPVEETTTIYVVNKTYYGIVPETISATNITDADVTALTSTLVKDNNFTYTDIISVASRIVYAYPAVNNELELIVDSNGLNYINSFTKVAININSIPYNVYISNDIITVNRAKLTFYEKLF